MRVYEILPNLFQSAYTRQLKDAACADFVAHYGFTGIVNLWTLPDERMRSLVADYVHCPIPDGKTISPARVSRAVDAVCQQVSAGGYCLVHCRGGRNRSALVVALTLKRQLGFSGGRAIEWIQAARPGALANEHFVRYILEAT
jgi:protein-tyrosine phosphatase